MFLFSKAGPSEESDASPLFLELLQSKFLPVNLGRLCQGLLVGQLGLLGGLVLGLEVLQSLSDSGGIIKRVKEFLLGEGATLGIREKKFVFRRSGRILRRRNRNSEA